MSVFSAPFAYDYGHGPNILPVLEGGLQVKPSLSTLINFRTLSIPLVLRKVIIGAVRSGKSAWEGVS